MKRKPVTDRCCMNPDCPLHGQLGKGSIIRHSFYKTSQGQRRRYLCKICKKTFVRGGSAELSERQDRLRSGDPSWQFLPASQNSFPCERAEAPWRKHCFADVPLQFHPAASGFEVRERDPNPSMQAGIVSKKLGFRDVFTWQELL